MEKAEPVTLTTMGHRIKARTTADTTPIKTAGRRGNPGICFKASAVPYPPIPKNMAWPKLKSAV
jgi:hypothetical protein